jgi:hypothetical protein
MPDWYVNAARALPPWNYAFQFPSPPQGERPPLISDNPIVLMVATLVSVASAAFASFGRELLQGRLDLPGDTADEDGPEAADDQAPDDDPDEGPSDPERQPE